MYICLVLASVKASSNATSFSNIGFGKCQDASETTGRNWRKEEVGMNEPICASLCRSAQAVQIRVRCLFHIIVHI